MKTLLINSMTVGALTWMITACGGASGGSRLLSQEPHGEGNTPARYNPDEVDYELVDKKPELEAYRQAFLRDAQTTGTLVPQENLDTLSRMTLSDNLGKDVLGVCAVSTNPKIKDRYIEILRPEKWPWQYPSKSQFRMTVYHELGHCYLGLSHSPRGEIAIMSPTSFPNETVETLDWESMVYELFASATSADHVEVGLALAGDGHDHDATDAFGHVTKRTVDADGNEWIMHYLIAK